MVFFQRRLTRLLIIGVVFLFVLYTLTPIETPKYMPKAGQLKEAFDTHVLKPIRPQADPNDPKGSTEGSTSVSEGSSWTGDTFPTGPSPDQEKSGPLQIQKELEHVDDFQEYVENLILSSFHPPYMINGRRMAFDPNRWRDFDRYAFPLLLRPWTTTNRLVVTLASSATAFIPRRTNPPLTCPTPITTAMNGPRSGKASTCPARVLVAFLFRTALAIRCTLIVRFPRASRSLRLVPPRP
jgi:hypothetical protein